MLTIKNRGQYVLLAALVFSACAPPGPRALLDGKKRLDKGQYEQAITKLELATEILSTNAQAWNYLGLAYHHGGKVDNADRAYQRALQLDRNLSEARYNLGCLYLEQGKFDQAKSALTAYTLENDQQPDGFLKLGAIASRAGDASTAEKAFQRALKLSPENPEALTGLGVVRQKRGRTVEAAELFGRALKSDPQFGPALFNYGVVAQQSLKDRPLAMQLFQKYLALKPPPTNTGPVIVAVNQMQRELAAAAMHAKGPESTTFGGRVGAAGTSAPTATLPSVAQQGTMGKASGAERVPPPAGQTTVVRLPSEPEIRTPTNASKPEPAQPEPKTGKKSVLSRLFGGKSPPENSTTGAPPAQPAVSPLKTYSYSNPAKPAPGKRADAERIFAQAVAARRALRVADAAKLYQQSTQLDPSLFDAQFNLALVQTELGNLQGAARSYEVALAIRPDSFDARYNLALLLKQMDFLGDSIRELEKVVASYPRDARPHLILGNIYSQQLKQNGKAREHYSRALELDPKNPQGPAIRSWLSDPRN